jgi:hemolysin activation/secretion protein
MTRLTGTWRRKLRYRLIRPSTVLLGLLTISTLTFHSQDLAATEPISQEQVLPVTDINIDELSTYPDQGLSKQDLKRFVEQFREKEGSGLTLEQVQRLADALTRHYRSAGFKFHSVYLANQNLSKTEQIKLTLLEASIGDIFVRGPDKELNEQAQALFRDLKRRILFQPDVDNVVLALKEQFGIHAFAYYSRGSALGEVRLNLKIKREDRGIVSLSGDNFGSKDTGRDRAMLGTSISDTIADFDRIDLGVQRVVNDDESNTFGFISYSLPLYSLDHKLGFSASNNVFEVGGDFTPLEIEGDASLFSFSYSYTGKRSLRQKHQLSLQLNHKTSEYENALNAQDLTEDETVNSAEFGWSYRYQGITSLFTYTSYLGLIGGNYELGSQNSSESFTRARLSQAFEYSVGDGADRWVNTFRWNLRGQYSNDQLPSFEKLSLTGAYSVRGFYAGYFSAERGGIATLEWWWPRLLDVGNENFRFVPFAFGDYGYGDRLDSNGNYATHVALSSGGLGLQVLLFENIVLTATGARGEVLEINNNANPEKQETLLQLSAQMRF